jgi:hypothetical protein
VLTRPNAEAALKAANAKVAQLENLRDILASADQSNDPKKPKKLIVTYDLNLQLLPAQGDPTEVYVAQLNHYPWRDDAITLKTTPEGLLTTGDANVVDRTSDIIVSIASALAAFGIVPMPTPPTGPQPYFEQVPPSPLPLACATQQTVTLQWVFDPTSNIDNINKSLIDCKVPYQLVISPRPLHGGGTNGNRDNNTGDPATNDGLLYRRPVPYLIEVQRQQYDPEQPGPSETEQNSSSKQNSGKKEELALHNLQEAAAATMAW